MERVKNLIASKMILFMPCEPESYEVQGITLYKDFYKCPFLEWVKSHPKMDAIGISTHTQEDYIIGYRPSNSGIDFHELFNILSEMDNDERFAVIHMWLPSYEKICG